jgi:hypothetical protein
MELSKNMDGLLIATIGLLIAVSIGLFLSQHLLIQIVN